MAAVAILLINEAFPLPVEIPAAEMVPEILVGVSALQAFWEVIGHAHDPPADRDPRRGDKALRIDPIRKRLQASGMARMPRLPLGSPPLAMAIRTAATHQAAEA
jgi:hypothetical protein